MTAWRVQAVRLPDGADVEAGISATGTWTSAPERDAALLPGRFVLPGLVDAHCHLSVAEGADGGLVALDADGARAALDRARAAGVTAVRDTGSPHSVTLELLAATGGAGLQACGRFLAPQGQYFPALLPAPVTSGDLVEAALAEVAAGARWVKLIGDFQVVDSGDPEAVPTYAAADVRRLVEAVHDAGARVAVHTTSRYVGDLIAAGVDSVEHGTELTEDDLVALAGRGGAWTPTLCATVEPHPGDDPDRRRRLAGRRERLASLLPAAAELGVTIMTGSDIVGTVAREVALLAELGLRPETALAAASTSAREFLGFPALAEGEAADLVSYADDPRDDPAVLAHPAAVFVRGVRVA